MAENRIKNFEELATTENRRSALLVAEAALESLDTVKVMERSVSLRGDVLNVQGENFDLSKFKNIKVVGFGKASYRAALALEKILGPRITAGAVIGLEEGEGKYIKTFAGTHPKPSAQNVLAGQKIFEIVKNSSGDDLLIVLVSGGGSALLCSSEEEREQGIKLYESFLKTGKTIGVLNTVRKHLSVLKGGGLAKIAYPATVIGLVFSDVPGDNFGDVASGPTYKDLSTVADAAKIISDNNLGEFNLMETPKDDKYFEKVRNFVLVSNTTATEAMAAKAAELGFAAHVISTELYDETNLALEKIFSAKQEQGEKNTVIIAAGESKLKVSDRHGKGGRNSHMALLAACKHKIGEDSVFISLASDGLDNSDAAGAIVDKNTCAKAKGMDMDGEVYLHGFNSYEFFKKTGDMLITGPTGANVSDLMLLLKKND
jgi:glycerate-2-kinase